MRIIDPNPTDPDVMPPMWCVVDGEECQDGTPLLVAWTDRRADAERIARALALTSPPSGAMVARGHGWGLHQGGWRPKL